MDNNDRPIENNNKMTTRLQTTQVKQGSLRLFCTSVKVGTLLSENFCTVNRLNPETGEGIQRLLDEKRAGDLARHILEGQENNDVFLPSSIFLATDQNIDFDEKGNTISFDVNNITSEINVKGKKVITKRFSVVDGQHRLGGFREAIKRVKRKPDKFPEGTLDRILNFELPVCIADNLSVDNQKAHFLVVNTTQKNVDKNTVGRLQSKLSSAYKNIKMHAIPHWIKKILEKGVVPNAEELVLHLNREPQPPWCGRIWEAGVDKKLRNKRIQESTFKDAIQKFVLKNEVPDSNKIFVLKEAYMNYWKAMTSILDKDGNSTALYLVHGVNVFSAFYGPIARRLFESSKEYTVDNFKEYLIKCFENVMDEDHAGIGFPEFWEDSGKVYKMDLGNWQGTKAAVKALIEGLREVRLV